MDRGLTLLGPLILVAAEATAAKPPTVLPMAETVVEHVGLSVANAEVSAEFYQRILGLRPIPQTASPTMRWLRGGTVQLHLIGGRTKPVDGDTDTHFAFRVRSLSDELAILDRNHVAWSNADGAAHKVTTRFDGVMQAYFQDPDGYWIEVNQARQ